MRRIKQWNAFPAGVPAVLISKRDYRLMRAVVRAADDYSNRPAGRSLKPIFDAVDAFNAASLGKP